MNKIKSFVDKIYCINLDSRKDRWEEVKKQFINIGIFDFVKRISAVTADDPRVGCLRSHLICVDEAINRGYDNILIFEDDVRFLPYDNTIIADVIEFLKRDIQWELFYLGGVVMYPARFVHKNVFKSNFFSTHAYVINKRAFTKVQRAGVPIDKWYSMNTTSYGINPIFATQMESYSDIRKKVIINREDNYIRKYRLLVEPNIFIRWINYIKTHYLIKYRLFF